jgi:hypothetical protein
MLAGVTNGVLRDVQEVEEGMISIVYKAECANEVTCVLLLKHDIIWYIFNFKCNLLLEFWLKFVD